MMRFSCGLFALLLSFYVMGEDKDDDNKNDNASALEMMKDQCDDAIEAAQDKNPDKKAQKRIDEASALLKSIKSSLSYESKMATYACCIMKAMGNYKCSISTIKEQVKEQITSKINKFFE